MFSSRDGCDFRPFVEDEAIGSDGASTPGYGPTAPFPFRTTSPLWHRSSDPHPVPGTGGGYYASSEPLPGTSGSATKHSFKEEGCFYDSTNREHERCEQKLQICRRQRKEAEKLAKEAEELAESRGIRLFHSLKKAKDYDDAERLYPEIIKERKSTENEEVLDLSHSFAAMLVEQKKFLDAEPISTAVWEKRKEDPGPPSELSKGSHRQLCSILCAVRKHKDAENMQRNMYQTGPMDAWALENGDEVCQRLREQREIKKAKEMQDEVWTKRMNQYGPRDALTIRSGLRLVTDLRQLIVTIDDQDGSEAERRLNDSHKRTFECEIEVALRKIWDPRPQPELTIDILDAGHMLGVVIFGQKRFSDAEAILIQVWEGKKRNLGDRHAGTISTGSMLGRTLCRQGEQETYRRAVDILPEVWQTMKNNGDSEAVSSGEDLAQAYRSLGRWPSAEKVYEWIVHQKMQKRYPTREIEDAHWLLGQTLLKQAPNKNRQAEVILSGLYKQWKASSPDPSKTLECGSMLAQLLSTQGEKVEEAREIAQDVFNRRHASEERGVAYLESGYLYGSLLLKGRKLPDAESILKAVWEHQAEGTEEQKVRLRCGHLFGRVLAERQKYPQAKVILEAAADTQALDSAGLNELAKIRKLLEVVNRQKKAKKKVKRMW